MCPTPRRSVELPPPLGATVRPDGVEFSVYAGHADGLEICLFDPEYSTGASERRVRLTDRVHGTWFGFVPGIGPSPDKMLQGRLFAYGDTQRYRLGINHTHLPVNRPHGCPANNYSRHGAMRSALFAQAPCVQAVSCAEHNVLLSIQQKGNDAT